MLLRQSFTQDEHIVASAVAALASTSNKHRRDEEDGDVGTKDCKIAKVDSQARPKQTAKKAPVTRVLRPAPFFFYKDFSQEPDNDPFVPLTSPGRVPNFPAKLHAILSRKDLKDVVTWLPHGRAWRILKPREFEIKILPTYFDHNKFSSFIRQANGWGFRRLTDGPDRNAYYHEKFLRGLPHLSKDMKRPGVNEKVTVDPTHEPNFYEINKIFPLPEPVEEDESVLLQCTLQGGPKARMPIYTSLGSLKKTEVMQLPPHDRSDSFQQAIATPESKPHGYGALGVVAPSYLSSATAGSPSQGGNLFGSQCVGNHGPTLSTMPVVANQLLMQPTPKLPPSFASSSVAASVNTSQAVSQFAAGFAAATALSQHQFRSILDKLAQGQQGLASRGFGSSGL